MQNTTNTTTPLRGSFFPRPIHSNYRFFHISVVCSSEAIKSYHVPASHHTT